MDLYRIGMPEDKDVIIRDNFVIDEISPLCIKKISEEQYSILFFAEQRSTETSLFLISTIKYDKSDEGFLNNHPLNIVSIRRDPDRLEDYNNKINSIAGNVFNTDFNMKESETNRRFFETVGVKALNLKNETKAAVNTLFITRDNFIKISIFITKFLKLDYSAEEIFKNKKIKNVEFMNVEYVRLNGSSQNKLSGIVYSNYTVGNGPTSYDLNFVSPVIEDRDLKNPVSGAVFDDIFMNSYLVNMIIGNSFEDKIYVLYEVRDKISNFYKKTIILVMNNEIYNKTNFINPERIYKDKKSKQIIV